MVNKSLVFGIILIFTVGVMNIPLVDVQEAYTELEPYEEQYIDLETFSRDCKYRLIDATLESHISLSIGIYHTLTVFVQNIDDYGGQFSVELRLYDVDGLFSKRLVLNHIGAGLTETFSTDFDTELGQDVRGEYTVNPPLVSDQRSVTKTRIAYRQVTKYKTVKKSILAILTQS